MRSAFLLALTLLTVFSCGCNSFGNNRLVKELQSENERLLAEFRAQRDRNEELEKAHRVQAERLAESEKLLARLSQSTDTGKLSRLSPAWGQPAAGGSETLPNLTPKPGIGPWAGQSTTGQSATGQSTTGQSSNMGPAFPADSTNSASQAANNPQLRWQPRPGQP